MFGFLNVYKPAGPTSHDIVDQVRRRIGSAAKLKKLGRIKVGHAGTLDPFADGVLVICLGPATRLADYIQEQLKHYVASIVLGATSETDDTEGDILPTPGAVAPAIEGVRQVLTELTGTIEQVPPAHSAVRVSGRRAYKIARSGAQISLRSRPVTVHSLELLDYNYPQLKIAITCSGGTYIRSLARDIGRMLGCGAYCDTLTRTGVGEFDIANARRVDQLEPTRDVLSPLLAIPHLLQVKVNPADAERIALGRALAIETIEKLKNNSSETKVAIIDHTDRLLAIGRITGQMVQPERVFFPKYGKNSGSVDR